LKTAGVGEIATSTVPDFAQSTPENFHFQSSAFHDYHTVAIAEGGPVANGNYMQASDAPGMGVEPDMKI
jgi:L-alanine-DL-glutamate epimerase-like enolase superfamily enzyme